MLFTEEAARRISFCVWGYRPLWILAQCLRSATHVDEPSISRLWSGRLDLVFAPGQRSSACPKARPRCDTLKQSRLIQQSISGFHFLCSCHVSEAAPPPFSSNTCSLQFAKSLRQTTSVVWTFHHTMASWQAFLQISYKLHLTQWQWRYKVRVSSVLMLLWNLLSCFIIFFVSFSQLLAVMKS